MFLQTLLKHLGALWHVFVAIFMVLVGSTFVQFNLQAIGIGFIISAVGLLVCVSVYYGVQNGTLKD